MKLLIVKFSPLPCYLVPLRPKYSTQLFYSLYTLFSNTLNLRSSLTVSDQVSPHTKQEAKLRLTITSNS
jgi:hypothetical protein